jgi:hypothetical protein
MAGCSTSIFSAMRKSKLRFIIVKDSDYMAVRKRLHFYGIENWGEKERFKLHKRTAIAVGLVSFFIISAVCLSHGVFN